MQYNSPGSARRTTTTHRHTPSLKEHLNENATIQFSITKGNAQQQEDSRTHESVGQSLERNGRFINEEAEAEVAARQSSSFLAERSIHSTPSQCEEVATYDRSMRIPSCFAETKLSHQRLASLLKDKSLQPPVTIATLQELDLHSIQQNLNLRIDICHDPELFFQPITGQKGDVKRKEAKKYWSALVLEFQIYLHHAQPACLKCRKSTFKSTEYFRPRLPAVFDNLRAIIQMLVPDSDHEEVNNHLDTELLMQQISKGALDAVRLSSWLAKLLTSHCAPMRDEAAAEVTDKILNGTEQGDTEILVESMENLFTLLEAMKLDIANHQIRSFRYALIAGTVEFQQEHFSKAVNNQQMDITESLRWYEEQCRDHRFECEFEGNDEAAQRFACFIHGLVHLVSPSEKYLPLTLQYDQHRIARLREDLQDHIQLNLCLGVFNQQAHLAAGSKCDPSTMHEQLKNRIICLTEDNDGNGSAISDHLDAVGIEIARAAFAMRSSRSKNKLPLSHFDINRSVKTLKDVFNVEEIQQTVTKDFLDSLEARTMQYAERFNKMTTVDVSTSQKQWALTHLVRDNPLAEWDEMARKLAHIAVIHWRVWRDICYWEQEQESEQEQEQEQEPQQECFYETDELDSSTVIDCYDSDDDDEANTSSSGRLQSSPLSSKGFNMELDRNVAFKQGTAAMQDPDAQIQRQDSGFAEFIEDLEREVYIDMDQNLEPRQRLRSGTNKRKPGRKRLSGFG